ncbi:uncharacterized protein F4822DRAFT_404320 [Hypoxylon trugodes]|uniref:uncharacterized protein n=1 Tax=Hypoxylon trugodes TaxID=326681 RepID=UPI0021939686|nr:uncharacterized protein F4822DRAFT_404320 [Hypoxylon trugodes]KAI1388899.1 hypothetical protein F4822DRAFT_404320 [Hypoxylon trugodes]
MTQQKVMVDSESAIVTTFPRFQDLPAELRLLIWRFSLPRRAFEIRRETVSVRLDDEVGDFKDLDHDAWRLRSSDLVAVILAPPALLSVCRESRKIAKRTGSWKCVGSRPRGICRVLKLETWFDPTTDTLCFDDSAIQNIAGQITERNGLQTENTNNPAITRFYFAQSPVSPVCVSLAALAGNSGKFFAEQWNRRLRGFWHGVPQCQYYHDSILMHLGRSPKVQEIFGKGADRCHTLLVDARDYGKLRKLHRLYVDESDTTYSQRRVADWLERVMDPEGDYIEQSQNDLKDLWLKAQENIPFSSIVHSPGRLGNQTRSLLDPGAVLHTILQQFDHTHPWCQGVIKGMPNMRLVIHFRLCITNHDKKHCQKIKVLGN